MAQKEHDKYFTRLFLNKIEDAIKKHNISKVTSNKITSEVEPYKVVAFDGIWYLLAREIRAKKIKTYLVANIEEFRATSQVFESRYVDVDKVLQNVHTAWFEDGNSFEVTVKIKTLQSKGENKIGKEVVIPEIRNRLY